MTRYTHDHEPEEYEREAFTQPDVRLPGDGEYEWVLWWIILPLSGLLLSYAVIQVIQMLGGIFSW